MSGRRNPVREGSNVLIQSFHLSFLCPHKHITKYLLARTRQYPPNFSLSFTPTQKEDYGLLISMAVFSLFSEENPLYADQVRRTAKSNTERV
jgi:hypothetical protein